MITVGNQFSLVYPQFNNKHNQQSNNSVSSVYPVYHPPLLHTAEFLGGGTQLGRDPTPPRMRGGDQRTVPDRLRCGVVRRQPTERENKKTVIFFCYGGWGKEDMSMYHRFDLCPVSVALMSPTNHNALPTHCPAPPLHSAALGSSRTRQTNREANARALSLSLFLPLSSIFSLSRPTPHPHLPNLSPTPPSALCPVFPA